MAGNLLQSEAQANLNGREARVLAAQIRMLYDNAISGIAVTAIVAPALAYFQTSFVAPPIVLGWLGYMWLVSAARLVLLRRFRGIARENQPTASWSAAFAAGAALAGIGWGAASILLYPEAHLMNQVFLVFVLGGMMLGGASLLASRPEAFLAFLLPTGLFPAGRLLLGGDQEHVAMGLLGVLFTAAMLLATWRFHGTISSSLSLQSENRELLWDLQTAKQQTEVLNQHLEARVEERTAELQESTLHLQSEIKRREGMEEELLRVRNLESLGVLAGGIAHDFNNFLTVVQGNLGLVKMQLDPAAPVQEILERIIDAGKRAAFLSSQLLTFAKGGTPIRQVVSVAKLVMDAVHLARAGAPISVEVDIAEDLLAAEVDPGQIGQVLNNILLNAKQSMPDGGIIEVRAENIVLPTDKEVGSGAHVRISIRDYGSGIAPDILPRIFDPYFTTKPDHSGLGLATSYAIVAKHGGHISVESKGGNGTRFIIDLPASPETPAAERPESSRLRNGTGRLLVMDDEEALRTLLAQLLTLLGYEVETARDGADAIALYEEAMAAGWRFDAVLLDLTVSGGMSGIEAAVRLRELDPSAKLIVSSGYSDAPAMSNFREFGFDDVIPKPWKTAQLSEVFQRVLASQRERKGI